MKITKTYRKSESGASMVEMALALPLLVGVLLGLVDLGFMFWQNQILGNAAREGTKKAAVLPVYNNTTVSSVQSYVQSKIFAAGLIDTPSVSVLNPPVDIPNDGNSEQMASVTINATYRWKFLRALGMPPLTLSRTSYSRYEWQTDPVP